MNTNFLFEDNAKIAHAVGKDLATATTGNRVKMDSCERLVILIAVQASAAATVKPQLKQHNAATGGTSKALTINNAYYHKVGAATVFTKVDAGADYLEVDFSAIVGANESLMVLEILPEQLDTNNGFAWASVDFPVAGGAKLASTMYILEDSQYAPAHEVSI